MPRDRRVKRLADADIDSTDDKENTESETRRAQREKPAASVMIRQDMASAAKAATALKDINGNKRRAHELLRDDNDASVRLKPTQSSKKSRDVVGAESAAPAPLSATSTVALVSSASDASSLPAAISAVSSSPPSVSSSYDAILQEKDAAYSELLGRYEALRQQRTEGAESLRAQYDSIAAQHMQAAQQLAQHWKAQHDSLQAQHAQAIASLHAQHMAQVTALTSSSSTLQSRVQEEQQQRAQLERELDAYLLLLGGRVHVKPDGRIVCKLVNGQQGRVLEFVLDSGKEEGQVEYRPKQIVMGGDSYPSDLKQPMWFKTERTPNFTRYLLSLLYKKTDCSDEEQQQQRQAEQQQDGSDPQQPAAVTAEDAQSQATAEPQ